MAETTRLLVEMYIRDRLLLLIAINIWLLLMPNASFMFLSVVLMNSIKYFHSTNSITTSVMSPFLFSDQLFASLSLFYNSQSTLNYTFLTFKYSNLPVGRLLLWNIDRKCWLSMTAPKCRSRNKRKSEILKSKFNETIISVTTWSSNVRMAWLWTIMMTSSCVPLLLATSIYWFVLATSGYYLRVGHY